MTESASVLWERRSDRLDCGLDVYVALSSLLCSFGGVVLILFQCLVTVYDFVVVTCDCLAIGENDYYWLFGLLDDVVALGSYWRWPWPYGRVFIVFARFGVLLWLSLLLSLLLMSLLSLLSLLPVVAVVVDQTVQC